MRLPELRAEPPCRTLEPRLEAFAARHRDRVAVYRVDLDHNVDTPRDYGVAALPTVVLLCDGRELARLDGLIRDEDLEALLEAPR